MAKVPSFYSGGAGNDNPPIHTPTDANFSCGGLPYTPTCDYGQREEPSNDQMTYGLGLGSGEVGHNGSVQNYGIEDSPAAGGGSEKNTKA